MSTRTVTVYEVVVSDNGPGKYGDGIDVFRFRSKDAASAFAAEHTLYGSPATAARLEVPRTTARAWGVG